MVRHTLRLCAALLLAAPPAGAATLAERVRAWRETHAHEVLRELAEFLALPNLASDSAGIRANADHLVRMLERRGIAARLLESRGSPPAVFGELRVPGARRTVTLYAHYDGQPVDPANWRTPPWTPTLLTGAHEDGGAPLDLARLPARLDPESRLYARSASDDKAPIVAVLAALDALRAAGARPSVNLHFFFEGEEEAGSEHLGEMLRAHAELLASDGWLFLDGPVHQSRRMQVVFGVRGVLGMQLTVFGPARPVHSGHYGNWAPNPAAMLARLIAGMRDEEGRVLIEGFYDDVAPLAEAERAAIAALPDVETGLRRELAIGRSESEPARLAERILEPALNVQGLSSGAVGEKAANAVPAEASAAFDFRLVPQQHPERVRELVEAHLRSQGWHVVRERPDTAVRAAQPRVAWVGWEQGYPAVRTAMDLPFSRAVLRAVEEAAGPRTLRVPALGGSLPLHHFQEVLGVPLVIVPTVNHDNNQHAANENLRLQNLWDAVEVFANLMARLGPHWREAGR